MRVEAARLRRALRSYYADAGRDHAITIELPTGHYVPCFHRAADQSSRDNIRKAIRRLCARAAAISVPMGALTAATLLASLIGAGIALWSTHQIEAMGSASTIADAKGPRLPDDPLPVVYVKPIDVTGTPVTSNITPMHLQIELCDALARFDKIIVITDGECGDPQRIRPSRAPNDPGYRLRRIGPSRLWRQPIGHANRAADR